MWLVFYLAGFAAYLLTAAIASLIASGFAGKAKSAKVGWGVFAAFIALPVADAALSYMYFEYLCATEGGVKIYHKVDSVEGYLIEGFDWGQDKEYWQRSFRSKPNYGRYQFVETWYKGNGFRYSHDKGVVSRKSVKNFKSKYKLRKRQVSGYLFNVGKSVYEVVDIQSGRVIARKAVFGATMTTLRPWLQKDPCPKKIVSDAAMVLEVLAPALDAG